MFTVEISPKAVAYRQLPRNETISGLGPRPVIGMNLLTFPKRRLDILRSYDVINVSRDHSYNVQETIHRLCEHVIIDFDNA